jgi:hypothetical protein
METRVFGTAFVLTIVSLILAVPFVHEIYKSSFEYTNWKHVLRMSGFLVCPILSVIGMLAVIQNFRCLARATLFLYLLTLPVICHLLVLGVIESSTAV